MQTHVETPDADADAWNGSALSQMEVAGAGGSRWRHRVEHLLEDLDAKGVLDADLGPADEDLRALFDAALRASAVGALAAGEGADSWTIRQGRRWGSDAAVSSAVEEAQQGASAVLGAFEVALARSGVSLSPPASSLSSDPRTDIPSGRPAVRYPAWAGIKDVDLVLRLAGGAPVTAASTAISVELPPSQRGAHMSRLQQAVVTSETQTFGSVIEGAVFLASTALAEQAGTAAMVEIQARRKVPTTGAVSGKPSSLITQTRVNVTLRSSGAPSARLEVEVGVITACPCTLRYSGLRAEEVVGPEAASGLPATFTHSQPGILRLSVAGPLSVIPADELLLEVAGEVAHLREAVLKRPDEHDLVERAHLKPQFTEDLARSAARALAARVDGEVMIAAEALALESIHPHSAVAVVEGLAREFWRG